MCLYGFIFELSVLFDDLYVYLFLVLHCGDYNCSIVRFEIVKCESSYFFFTFEGCFGDSAFFLILHFRLSLSISTKKSSGVLIGITLYV